MFAKPLGLHIFTCFRFTLLIYFEFCQKSCHKFLSCYISIYEILSIFYLSNAPEFKIFAFWPFIGQSLPVLKPYHYTCILCLLCELLLYGLSYLLHYCVFPWTTTYSLEYRKISAKQRLSPSHCYFRFIIWNTDDVTEYSINTCTGLTVLKQNEEVFLCFFVFLLMVILNT